jgi:hypothetical protein
MPMSLTDYTWVENLAIQHLPHRLHDQLWSVIWAEVLAQVAEKGFLSLVKEPSSD